MTDNNTYSDKSSGRERPSSGWQSASERRGQGNFKRDDRGFRSDRRRDDDRRGGFREDRGGRRFDRNDRFNDRGDRRDDRGGRRWEDSDSRSRRNDRFNDRNDRFERRDDRGFRSDRRRDDDRRGGFREDRGGRRFDRNDRFERNERSLSRDFDHGQSNPDESYESSERSQLHRLQYEIPESITSESLDAATRQHLRNLNKENSEVVARHLAYAGEMMDIDPEVAYNHAKAAFSRAARIDVVREALGLTSYVTGRYSEALSELRTYRRMSDDFSHVAIEADSERGLGRSEKALRFIDGIPLARLDAEAKIELAIVASGAKADMGDSEGGLAVLNKILVENLSQELGARVELVKADRLEELGRDTEATELREKWAPIFEGASEDLSMVFDLNDVLDDEIVEPEVADDFDDFDDQLDDDAFEKVTTETDDDPEFDDCFDELFEESDEDEELDEDDIIEDFDIDDDTDDIAEVEVESNN
ncbi:hypothetical protein [Arcanobacterium ihumii]|uniref:hypothetical protein n=1 Tax=Arcanobacterium ihumii TaxID=2138162 RepID=UPI00135675D7|nr:hypothetical protein [Arcanobacterium ihumii]